MDSQSERVHSSASTSVCVIGAGVSGLVAAKIFSQEGAKVTVFEKEPDLGGVWTPRRVYPSLTTQTPGNQYAFSDFPMPSHYPDWPSAAQVLDYLRRYANQFKIAPLIRYGTTVQRVHQRAGRGSGWSVTVSDPSGTTSTHEFDFVIVCNGTFSTPSRPIIPNEAQFTESGGSVLHSSELVDAQLVAGKRVVVVGFGKSATDIATYATETAREVHLVFRRLIWPVPRFLGGLLHVRYLCTSRLWESLMPPLYPEQKQSWGHRLWRAVPPLCWRGMEKLLARQFGLTESQMRPAHSFGDQITTGFLVSPEGFFDHVKSGKIRTHHATVTRFDNQGVELSNQERLSADVVILGTGFRQELPFLDSDVREIIVDREGRFHLYRYLLNPEIPDLGFVGYNSSLFTPITSELGARWLAAYRFGRMTLPAKETMHDSIESELKIGKAVRPLARRFTAVNVAPYTYHYLDTLLRDLGHGERVQKLRALIPFLKPFAAADFA